MIDLMYSEKFNSFSFAVHHDTIHGRASFLTLGGSSKEKALENAMWFNYKKERMLLNTVMFNKKLAASGAVKIETFDYNSLEEFLDEFPELKL